MAAMDADATLSSLRGEAEVEVLSSGAWFVLAGATGSTNDDALLLAQDGAPHGTAVAARNQTAGRGRRGHRWESPEGGMYLSVLLRPGLPMRLLPGAPLVCALGVLDVLERIGVGHAHLKWPNDVVAAARKLAGLLVETVPSTSGEDPAIVCGVGVNLETPELGEEAHPEGMPPLEPIGLRDILAYEDDVPPFRQFARMLQEAIVSRCDEWSRALASGGAGDEGPLAPALDDCRARLAYADRRVEALSPTGAIVCVGELVGIDGWGRAVVACDGGETVAFTSEQVGLRPLTR